MSLVFYVKKKLLKLNVKMFLLALRFKVLTVITTKSTHHCNASRLIASLRNKNIVKMLKY